MPAALRSVVESNYPSKKPASKAKKNQDEGRVSEKRESSKIYSQKIEKPGKRADAPIPVWWRSLLLVHQASSVLTFILIASSLIVYALTVYTEKLWSKDYQKLETLQRHERQLIATNETLKNQFARQAEQSETGLLPPNPDRVVFLHPAPENLTNKLQTVKKAGIAPLTTVPSGY